MRSFEVFSSVLLEVTLFDFDYIVYGFFSFIFGIGFLSFVINISRRWIKNIK